MTVRAALPLGNVGFQHIRCHVVLCLCLLKLAKDSLELWLVVGGVGIASLSGLQRCSEICLWRSLWFRFQRRNWLVLARLQVWLGGRLYLMLRLAVSSFASR